MRNMQSPKGSWHKAGVFAMLLVCSSLLLLLLPGCRNLFDSQDTARTGTLSLRIDRQGVERTILPDISIYDFYRFDLTFVHQSTGYSFNDTWWGDSIGTFSLASGVWNLYATAFFPGGLAAAEGRTEGIVVPPGGEVSGSVMLFPIAEGTGTFSWDIDFDDNIRVARMEIRWIDGSGNEFSWWTFFLVNDWGWSGGPLLSNYYSIEMYAGQYIVILTMVDNQNVSVTINETLHVYRNMTSHFQDSFDFPVTMLRFILDAWDGWSWNFAERGIAAGHFSIVGVNGINDDNFSGIVYWFNILQSAAGWNPSCCCDLGRLTDAALIGIASGDADFLNAGNYRHRGEVEVAIVELIQNASSIAFNWIDDRTVNVTVAGTYTVQVVFSADLEPPPFGVGESLADQLAWLRAFSQSGQTYNIVISGDEDISVLQAVLPTGRSNLTLNLSATGPSTVTLTSNGSLFTLGSGVTLALGDNITLHGMDGNNAPLVRVNSGGNLVMNAGAVITGNASSGWNGAGVNIDWGGIFTMNAGTISGNTNWASGGGVNISSGGTFTMHGGEIFNNAASTGGGVNISNGTFTMHGGAIFDNTASSSGGGVNISGGTFTMQDGEIFNNTASSSGGGGVNISWGTFNMEGGAIPGNTTFSGGGVRNSGTFNMRGGTIYDNTVSSSGGGVWNNGTFNMEDGVISGNITSSWDGGGVSNSGTFNMRGGTIYGNTASSSGGGVWNNGTFRISNGLIYGNNATALYNCCCGAAQFGRFSDGTFILSGWLDADGNFSVVIDCAIEVVDGVLIRPVDFITITISFDANSGSGTPPGSLGMAQERWINIPGQGELWRSGYQFDGWSTTPDGSGDRFWEWDSFWAYTDLTFYAIWIPGYTLTFDANSGSGTPPSPMAFDSETWVVIPGQGSLWRSGYNFGGWNTAPSGSGAHFWPGDSIHVTQAITLYAQWAAIQTLADRFAWLRAHAEVGGTYIIDISVYGGGHLTPTQAALPTSRSDLTIILEASEPNTISLASNGNLFAIGSGVTLVLGYNVTLMGRGPDATPPTVNNTQLVRVNSGGTLVMNEGSRITGNTVTSPPSEADDAGGVRVNAGGRLVMYGGEISHNNFNANFPNGGGVDVLGGTFEMHDGRIFGNNTNGTGGGGVRVHANGTFHMSGGVIYGNELAVEEELRNTASNGAALFNNGTAQIGTFNNGTFSASVTLSTTNYTIHVVDGVRLGRSLNLNLSLEAFRSVETDISGPTISILGIQHENSASVTVLDPGQYDSIIWRRGGSDITWGGEVSGSYREIITLSTGSFGNQLGTHFVTVEVRIDGVLYSKRIAFTVVP